MIVYCDSIFTFLSSLACFASAYQISSQLVNPRQSYDVISISQDGGHDVANLLPAAGLVTELVREGQNLSAYQISMRYLNPRPSYYYFRFPI